MIPGTERRTEQSDERQTSDIGRSHRNPCRTARRSRSGGNTLHRGPGAAVHEIVRQGKRGLEIVKTAGAYDVDLLCAAGCVRPCRPDSSATRRHSAWPRPTGEAVESGVVEAREHACATVIAGLRAAIQGVPFMPVAGLHGSDLPAARGFQAVADPYSEAKVYVVPALHSGRCDSPRPGGRRGRERPHHRHPLRRRADGPGGTARDPHRGAHRRRRRVRGGAGDASPFPAFWSTPSSRRRAAPGPSPARRTTNTTPRIWRPGSPRRAIRRRRANSSPTSILTRRHAVPRVSDSATGRRAVGHDGGRHGAAPAVPARRSFMAWRRRCRWWPRSWRNACMRRISPT